MSGIPKNQNRFGVTPNSIDFTKKSYYLLIIRQLLAIYISSTIFLKKDILTASHL